MSDPSEPSPAEDAGLRPRRRAPSHGMDRRSFLRLGGVATVGLGSALAGCAGKRTGEDSAGSGSGGDPDGSTDGTCPATDDNIEGPFYREDAPARDDLDQYEDEGTPLRLTGQVVSAGDCTPLAGAEVDVWHADPTGAYDNKTEEMRYRGVVTADADGRFALTTLVPGWYLNGSTYRPAHIHVKVRVGGAERLTTQLYFEGDPYLAGDPFVEGAPVMAVVEGDVDGEAGWTCEVELAV